MNYRLMFLSNVYEKPEYYINYVLWNILVNKNEFSYLSKSLFLQIEAETCVCMTLKFPKP